MPQENLASLSRFLMLAKLDTQVASGQTGQMADSPTLVEFRQRMKKDPTKYRLTNAWTQKEIPLILEKGYVVDGSGQPVTNIRKVSRILCLTLVEMENVLGRRIETPEDMKVAVDIKKKIVRLADKLDLKNDNRNADLQELVHDALQVAGINDLRAHVTKEKAAEDKRLKDEAIERDRKIFAVRAQLAILMEQYKIPVGTNVTDLITDIKVDINLRQQLVNLLLLELKTARRTLPTSYKDIPQAYRDHLAQYAQDRLELMVSMPSNIPAKEVARKPTMTEFSRDLSKANKKREQIQANLSKVVAVINRLQDEAIQRRESISLWPSSLLELLTSPKIPQNLRMQLREAIIQRLTQANMLPANPNDSIALLAAYDNMTTKEYQDFETYGYEDFLANHPFIKVENIAVTTNSDNLPYLTEITSAKDQNVTIFTAKSANDDSVGIAQNADGIITAVVADGASGSALPQIASRTAVHEALNILRATPLRREIIKNIHDILQQIDIPGIIRHHDITILRRISSSSPQIAAGIHALRKHIREKIGHPNPDYSNTTFGALKYDRKNNRVDFVLKSDVTLVVFRANKKKEIYRNPSNSTQIAYLQRLNDNYFPDSVSEKFGMLTLEKGDVVMLTSDGLEQELAKSADPKDKEKIYDDINDFLNLYRNDSRRDKALANYLRSQIKMEAPPPYGPADDLTAVFIHHE